MSPRALYRVLLFAAGIVLAALLVEQLLTVLLAVSVTIIVALPLEAAASWGQRRGLPRGLGAVGALVLALLVLGAIGLALLPEFTRQVSDFAGSLPAVLRDAGRRVHVFAGVRLPNLGLELGRFVEGYTKHPERLAGTALQLGLGLLGLAIASALMLFVAVVAAINPQPLVEGVVGLIPAAHQASAREVLHRVHDTWLRWQLAVLLDMVVLGGLLFIGLTIVGLPFALGFALFSAFLTVIPNYGSIISAIPPIVVGLAHSPTRALLVLLVYVIVNQIEGNLILPLIMARTVAVHPAIVTLGLLAVASLFGLIGIVIAIPLLTLAMILVEVLWIEPSEARASARASARAPVSGPGAAR
jgi:predicted PurR-regulated permease PerM